MWIISSDNRGVLLQHTGPINQSAVTEVTEILDELYDESMVNVTIDLQNTQIPPATGFVTLLGVKNDLLKSKNGFLRLVKVSDKLYETFDLLGITKYVDINK